MKNTGKINKSLFDIEPSTMVCIYQIDLKDKGTYLFHAGENGYHQNIVFGGQEYQYYPIKVEGFEMQGDGRLPRPKMTFSNQRGNISMRLDYFNDFTNYRVTRRKTFVKYLDAVNFPNNFNPFTDPDPEASFTDDVFYVNQKTKEDDNIVEFELVSLLELQNSKVPARTMYSNYCPWRYRGSIGCGYKGKPIADAKNKRFVDKGYNEMNVGEEVYLDDGTSSERLNNLSAKTIYQDWEMQKTYNRGDVVKVIPFDFDEALNPANIYVCIQDGTTSNPLNDRQSWVLDECDRTLCGCRLRFSKKSTEAGGGLRVSENKEGSDNFWTEDEEGLPFGGFPGIDPYDYK